MKPKPILSKKSITRRSALTSIAGLTAGVALASPSVFSSAEKKVPEKAKIFALIGDHYHNSEYIRTALTHDIVKNMGISTKMTDDYSSLNAETLEGYEMLIVHRDGRIFPNGFGKPGSVREGRKAIAFRGGMKDIPIISDPPLESATIEMSSWMQPHQGQAVRDFVQNGGSALFFHNVTDVGSSNNDFRDVLGAAYAGHPPIRSFKVKVKKSDHPIMEGITDFVVTDEQHFMEYDKDPEYVLMESVNEDGLRHSYKGTDMGTTAPAVWAYDYGKGRVCYLEPGHLLTAHWNPMYQKLKQNAVRWLLRQGQ
ncbi:hypothetical protein BFP77_04555 [Maribacter sp. 4U21]|uniref:ThuA domain-containing protein n=1 Tax=Maribacter sp. 4U21 TaxID=1889779 RepID=UPI000C144E06|nr:ThuA domain-containing protein [Maribacter sp. 4U21]PIB30411.1 hypothetical protein BFP77_04555 [Maribacter sp. 4U21]